MLKIKQKTKKIFSISIITALVFFETMPFLASAATLTVPDTVVKPEDVDNGPVNSGDNQGGGMQNKDNGPKVVVNFSLAGDAQSRSKKVTATAVPSYFNNSSNPEELYFTWYLKKDACDLSSDVGENNKCDLDGDQKITENDWKIEAARIIVAGSFNANEVDEDGNNLVDYSEAKYDESIGDDSGFKATPSPRKTADDKDSEVWAINSGEDSNDIDAPNCYVQEPKSGLVYEMRRVTPDYNDCPDDAAGNHYHRACVSDQTASCSVLNPEYTQANIDARQIEIDAANAWNIAHPNDLHVVPTQISKTISNDFGVCAVAGESDDDFKCEITDLKNFKTAQGCKNSGEVAMCVRDNGYTRFPISATDPLSDTNPLLGIIFGKNASGETLITSTDSQIKNEVCGSFARPNENTSPLLVAPPDFLDNTQPAISASDAKCDSVKDKFLNGTKDEEGVLVEAGSSKFNPTCTFEKSVNMCKHLFPEVPREISRDGGGRAVSGDGEFGLDEKKFWGADPTKASTSGKGNDEKMVVGLGVNSFTWTYSPGDKVGVVVEGDSADPTKHADASFKRMWAFSNNTCKALEKLDKAEIASSDENSKGKRGMYIEGEGNAKTGFLTAEIDLDECLEENLLTPDIAGEGGLKVEMNTFPENPINDPNGIDGDVLEVSSVPINTKEQSALLYKWTVQKSIEGSSSPSDSTRWIDITKKAMDNGSFSQNDAEGPGKKDFSINLNFPESLIKDGITEGEFKELFYLRIKVLITGSSTDLNQTAQGSVIVGVRMQENSIKVYPVIASDTGMLSLNKGVLGQSNEMCADQAGKINCFVAANEIVGLEVENASKENKLSNFSWQVNGFETVCKNDCTVAGNKIFLPILGNVGEAVTVIAQAINEKKELVEISRQFIITTPQLTIESMDGNAWPKLLGYYKDLNSTGSCLAGGTGCRADLSSQVLETNEGLVVTLGTRGQSGFDWSIDGQIIPEYHNLSQIQFPINRAVGESYNIGLIATESPDGIIQTKNIRKALYKNWGILPDDAPEESRNANIQLTVVTNSAPIVADSGKSFFGASLITHLPEQLVFLFKISVVSALLLAITGTLFAIMPERIFREEK